MIKDQQKEQNWKRAIWTIWNPSISHWVSASMDLKLLLIVLFTVLTLMVTMGESRGQIRRNQGTRKTFRSRPGQRGSYRPLQAKPQKFMQPAPSGYVSYDRRNDMEQMKRMNELFAECGPKAFMKDGEALPREVSIIFAPKNDRPRPPISWPDHKSRVMKDEF